MNPHIIFFFIVISLSPLVEVQADKMDSYEIYSNKLDKGKVIYPKWFKTSFFDIEEDLQQAAEAGKRGVIVFFSQSSCNHCQALIDATLKDKQVAKRLRQHYDVIGMDIFSDLEVTDLKKETLPVKDYAERYRAYLTPTLLFYGVEKSVLLKIVGFYPPEKFHQVLDYIETGEYKKIKLSQYLKQKRRLSQDKLGLIKDEIFSKTPHKLSGEDKPLLIIFERPNCNACRRFHQRVLSFPEVRNKMKNFLAVQLDATDDITKIVTPAGSKITPAKWYAQLQLNYDVAIVYFDRSGKEVFRSDAETGKHRMSFTMDYVKAEGYKEDVQVQRWRRKQYIKKQTAIDP